jgi:LmbE family N-acetylglucosaminyl deacetylase
VLPLGLAPTAGRPLRVLALGCHSDDVEIGCGGTILALAEATPLEVCWVVLSGDDERAAEARASADDFLAGARVATVILGAFKDSYFPYVGGEVKAFVEDVRSRFTPDVIFTHQRNDLHQDHRLVCELTWNAFRDHLILEYEIPKWDGDMGAPNAFVPLSDDVARRKVELLMRHFGSQRSKGWFTEDLFRGLMRLRGIECRAPSGHAEAFYGRKLLLGPASSPDAVSR